MKVMRNPLLCALIVFLLFIGAAALPAETGSLHLTFVGDIMIHTANYLTPEYASIYDSVSWILRRDDLSFANLEFPVEPSRHFSSYPRFNGTFEYLSAVLEAGFEVFSLANNHAFDQGRDGIFQTLLSLERLGKHSYRRLYSSGIRGNLLAPFRPTEIRIRGLRIGFLAVCQMVNVPMPHDFVNIVDFENRRHRKLFISYIATVAREFDLFILSYHGGTEYSRRPSAAKISFFDSLLEAGVDIVWAHHPHVVQSYKLVEREEGRGLIMYCTGNFLSGMPVDLDPSRPENELAWTGDSAVWLVSVMQDHDRVYVDTVLPIPIANHTNGRGEILVSTFPRLDHESLSGIWRDYYRRRARLARECLRRSR